jgi:glycosyltransferase involved in cell wall biosynthesis
MVIPEQTRILVLGVKVPFTFGGQDLLVKSLNKELLKRGYLVDTVELPSIGGGKETILQDIKLWTDLKLDTISGKKVDLVIATKFPSHYIDHPKKSLWLVHLRREIYELYGTQFSDFSDDPRDEQFRRQLFKKDTELLSTFDYISGISKNVVSRLKLYNSVDAQVLYPPLPLGNRYSVGEVDYENPFILIVGRVCRIKRHDLLLRALPLIQNNVRVKIVGVPDEPDYFDHLKALVSKHHLIDRVDFLGRVSDDELINLYRDCCICYYAPVDEDYGYASLEAMACGKPVVSASDSGGVLEFVVHNKTGLVAQASPEKIAYAVNTLFQDKELYSLLSRNCLSMISDSGLLDSGWDEVLSKLTSPLFT